MDEQTCELWGDACTWGDECPTPAPRTDPDDPDA